MLLEQGMRSRGITGVRAVRQRTSERPRGRSSQGRLGTSGPMIFSVKPTRSFPSCCFLSLFWLEWHYPPSCAKNHLIQALLRRRNSGEGAEYPRKGVRSADVERALPNRIGTDRFSTPGTVWQGSQLHPRRT